MGSGARNRGQERDQTSRPGRFAAPGPRGTTRVLVRGVVEALGAGILWFSLVPGCAQILGLEEAKLDESPADGTRGSVCAAASARLESCGATLACDDSAELGRCQADCVAKADCGDLLVFTHGDPGNGSLADCLLGCAKSLEDPCREVDAKLGACGLAWDCSYETEREKCLTACFALGDCAELEGWFSDASLGDGPLTACTLACVQAPPRFACADATETIPEEWACDGSAECDDGSDEQDCSCSVYGRLDADLVRRCVYTISCDPLYVAGGIGGCIELDGNLDPCLLEAESCAAVAECKRRRFATEVECEAGPVGLHCEGDTAIYCNETASASDFAVDCGAIGGTCDPGLAAEQDEVVPCRLPAPDPCVDAAGVWSCSGDVAYSCIDGVPYGEDCASYGTICVELQGEAVCEPALAPCDDASPGVCDGSTLSVCLESGQEARFDCAQWGGECVDSEGEARCLAPGCSPEDGTDCEPGCFGSEMTLCVGGAQYALDCKDYGFEQCQMINKVEGADPAYPLCR